MTEREIPNIWPEGCKILIEVDEVQETVSGGMIIMPPSARENQQRALTVGTVLRKGPDAVVRNDGPVTFEEGTRIVFARYGGFNLNLQDIEGGSRKKRDLRLINDADVLAILG